MFIIAAFLVAALHCGLLLLLSAWKLFSYTIDFLPVWLLNISKKGKKREGKKNEGSKNTPDIKMDPGTQSESLVAVIREDLCYNS